MTDATGGLFGGILKALISSPDPVGQGLLTNVANLSAQRNDISPLGILLGLGGGSPASVFLAPQFGSRILGPGTFNKAFLLDKDLTPANAPNNWGIPPEPQLSIREQLGNLLNTPTRYNVTPIKPE